MKKDRIVVDSIPLHPYAPGNTTSERIITDPNGSYTGRPMDPEERPIQDADDL